ncbi:mannose-1-phosphate guanylyltransferase [Actinomyces bowdenii]|uniref:mannose-1-phosphate guanylyltransferase n=1 Tax=Actinomyces bowdenii TaxID=131109 RepID=UPI001ABC6DF7|nr:mannose-1-phosphate guanylyltransferase [Actinomyces bowdenii]MBO3724781.1 mannose-1-phosphate guanylyltransferase [Actinomyces bowdenii]
MSDDPRGAAPRDHDPSPTGQAGPAVRTDAAGPARDGGEPERPVHVIIPAGGAGTRLWPLSRRERPKFLLDLTGAGRTLIQATVERLAPLAASTTIVTGQAHLSAVAEQLGQVPRENLLAEPAPRDSMAAIGLAAAIIARRHGERAVVGSFAADHTIADERAFRNAVRQACALARQDWVVTIGIEATGPSTAFGYIHAGEPLGVIGAPEGRRVLGFTEKPDAATAAGYLASGDYRWNAGMFVARAGVLLDHLARYRPALAQGLRAIAAAWDTPGREEALARVWPGLEAVAIDHAIAEPAAAVGAVATVPASMGWDDVGGFEALTQLVAPRTEGSAAGASVLELWEERHEGAGGRERVEAIDSQGALVATATGRRITLLGVPGLVVVDTPDALLVTTPDRAQEVKAVVDRLKEAGRGDLL